jgi:hypothetical protein
MTEAVGRGYEWRAIFAYASDSNAPEGHAVPAATCSYGVDVTGDASRPRYFCRRSAYRGPFGAN